MIPRGQAAKTRGQKPGGRRFFGIPHPALCPGSQVPSLASLST
eukprot:CAMPEP_0204408082 /NCGR_PEP_ID=MMETSP0470-20130426/9191_1 /ASSEMBLY_ACC=CAM_ASM_000385 /TAXON_ID=2969 /ORGANISM="Oxyrrhis marina" /LENGTH=42 /DNA_ID= /DNA_START= /DNA_END= /DNA_ORIENTATION=